MQLARESKHRRFISLILNKWGELYLQWRKWDAALTAFIESHETARKIGVQENIAAALYGMAQVAAAQGNIAQARQQGQESWAVFASIGHIKAAEVKQWLEELPLIMNALGEYLH